MKHKILIPLLLIFSVLTLKAQDISKQNFQQAYQEISSMLEGKQPLDFEKAVFLTENAYRDNSLTYEDFKAALDVHSTLIGQLIKNNDIHDWKQFVRGNMGIAPDMEVEAKERYRKALANYAIFTYLTDTLTIKLGERELFHMPYVYSNEDPFGTADWKNSQTMNLLETQKGNCFSLVTLFKIFSERFKSDANIVTAPQHIYIEHRDPKGSRFNVEVATRSFPDFGSIQTLTYTTSEGLLNNISMRKLNLKQSVGLSLVYLAKGYEYKNKIKDDEFILTCANTVLQHDPKNLNALLLKAQVYEQRVMNKQMPSAPYESMLAEFYKLGYRQMPDDMREIILSKIQGRPSTVTTTDKTPNTFANIGEQSRTVTLSNGMFEEQHTPQKIVRYGQTIFDTEKGKIVKFLNEDISSYQIDPVVFALSVDPLTKSYPMLTPYQFASNTPIMAIDLDGLEAVNAMTGKIINMGSQENLNNLQSSNVSLWQDLFDWEYSKQYEKVLSDITDWSFNDAQRMTDASGDEVNTDYYAVTIGKLPPNMTEAELYQNIRKGFASIMDGNKVADLYVTDEKKWKSSNPVGTIALFEDKMKMDDSPVFASKATANYWIFTPLSTTWDWEHPLAGHRQFGLTKNEDGTYTFYTRGVDRLFDWEHTAANYFLNSKGDWFFKKADELWNYVMDKVVTDVNKAGGEAKKTHNFNRRVDWKKDANEGKSH